MTTIIKSTMRRRRRLYTIEMRRGHKLLTMIRPPELIADAMHRLDHGRVLRIDLDLLAQVPQVKVNGAVKHLVVPAVGRLNQRVSAPCRARSGADRSHR